MKEVLTVLSVQLKEISIALRKSEEGRIEMERRTEQSEERILQEIEQQFYEHDPAFAHNVGSTTLYRHAGRNLKWAALGFIAGFVVLITSFASSWAVGIVGFLVMFGCAAVFERNLRKMGKAGWQQWTASWRGGHLRESFGDAGRRFRDRFRRD